MDTIQDCQEEIIEIFDEINDWMFQYEFLLEVASSMNELTDFEKKDDNLVLGCQSKLWLICNMEQNRIKLKADSEALIMKGIVGLIIQLFDGRTPDEVAYSDVYFLEKTPLKKQMTVDRFKGIQSIIASIKDFAKANCI